MQHGRSIAFQFQRFLFLMADFGEGFDNVFFGIGHIMQLHGDGVFVVLQGDDRFVHSRLYVLGRVRHVFEQQ